MNAGLDAGRQGRCRRSSPNYLAASDRGDTDAIVRCFTGDAVVWTRAGNGAARTRSGGGAKTSPPPSTTPSQVIGSEVVGEVDGGNATTCTPIWRATSPAARLT